ncbi:BadF/BadG/BcrA/BcrD ATPase family protein [Pelagibius sp.]|uniref:BadF/BadG/BcrA/BcrD ATPase family protein n=1 Tax=Pelagibius sp. TaxID=1931238 RepID=UPI00261E5265|nr:BadF/BadG/BcrA/BcrD ATPase family protein [Pelagibius sp.]
MTQRQLFLGIDGGGTKCSARIVDAENRVVGEGRAGPANSRLGIDRAFHEIEKAAAAALADAGAESDDLSRLHAGVGLAGLSLQSDLEKAAAQPHPFASLAIDTDAFVACLGAHGGEDGGILVLGTGSCGCGLLNGETVTVGGWGFLLADHGSGASVGHRAVRASLLAHDGVTALSDLSRQVLSKFDGSPEKAVLWAAEAKPADFAELAPTVAEHAEADDPTACDLMRKTGEDASILIRALARKGLTRIALVGGFSPALRPWLAEDVRPLLVEPRGDALDGALILARRGLAQQEARP